MEQARHVAIIMDGNGRWAQQRGRPRTFGHIKGARVAKKIITRAVEKNIPYLTLYAFSSENWLRPIDEVSFLMGLLKRYLRKELATLVKQNIRFQVIGDKSQLPKEVLSVVNETVLHTAQNTGMILTFALSYGSRQEILTGIRSLALKIQNKTLLPEEITEDLISQNLYTSNMPDPDLIIRTSGEQRLSNFLLWQAAYSEFLFLETLWPDFTESCFESALASFSQRSRRFGKVTENELSTH